MYCLDCDEYQCVCYNDDLKLTKRGEYAVIILMAVLVLIVAYVEGM
jgi:hypothetical protein